MRIGIIGVGVIGNALLSACQQKDFSVFGYDKIKLEYKSQENFEAVLNSDIAFVCVPTLTIDRVQDLMPLNDVLWELSEHKFSGVVAVRCTTLPGTIDRMMVKFPRLRIVHNPEFLTALTPLNDILNQPAVLIGSRSESNATQMEKFWHKFDDRTKIRFHNPNVTELAKYIHNCFLATKVSFFNDMSEICSVIGVNYDEAMSLVHSVGKVGESHTRVPGPDGKPGWGGMCFPKDTSALSWFCEQYGIPAETLNGAIRGNNRRRTFYDF